MSRRPWPAVRGGLSRSDGEYQAQPWPPARGKAARQISIRPDPDVIARSKATGKGWQGRMNEALKRAKIE